MQEDIRNDWEVAEISEIYTRPLFQLLSEAHHMHARHHRVGEVQLSTLLSIKTGSCPEDCSYCAQSSRYQTHVEPDKIMDLDEILKMAKAAKDRGSTRFCMGAAWRHIPKGRDFQKLLNIVETISSELEMEVCVSAGSLNKEQAAKLKSAGCHSYNHNIDTSREFYPSIITTRSFDERLDNLKKVREAGIQVCSGGIIGLGETREDRISMLHTLATLPEHPNSVPINTLMPIRGTPLADREKIQVWELLRSIATARITMPKAIVRLSAGRPSLSVEDQALCFMAGANSIHTGEKLLTVSNCGSDKDQEMFELLGLTPMPANTSPSTV